MKTGSCSWKSLIFKLSNGGIVLIEIKNFSSVYRIFTKLGHMIFLWKGKNPIYVGINRSKVKVTVTMNNVFDNRVVSAR
jgi:hypothetical protein